ncbi:MAG: DAK2 domain-containing protein [Candidatus Metalachnospira sp.]|nr:DAK2 domain-containing protein [Candidatus Metalachnospira sp.]
MSVTSINGLLLKRMIISGANSLNSKKETVDSLNVFPVPDGDTGTNMSLTVLAAAREVEKSQSLSVSDIAKLAANGSLRGARGNSGVITSQLVRGFSKELEGLSEADTVALAKATARAVETAYKAVMKPKEGTILTVARIMSESALKYCHKITDITEFMEAVIKDGHAILLQTKEMLPVLKQADVVDAGGMGLLFFLEGAMKVIESDADVKLEEVSAEASRNEYVALASIDNESITFGYCTEFFINVKNVGDSTVSGLKNYLSSIGDSLVVVADDEIIKVHVHTDHPGMAIEKALSIGSLSGLKIDNMREQHTNKIDFHSDAKAQQAKPIVSAEEPKKEHKETGFISICSGSGLADIFRSLGVDYIIEGGQTMNPSTEDILNAINKIDADNIVIMPNNKNIILAAEQAKNLTEDKKVFVVPTRSVPEAISAMLCYNAEEPIEDVIEEMDEAIKNVTTASVTYAVRDTKIGDTEITKGDILGMLNDDIAVVGKDISQTTEDLIKKAANEDSEIISIYYGSDATEEMANEIAEFAGEQFPDCDIEIHAGNQQLYYYIISVE